MRGHPIDLLDEVAGWLEEADIEVVYTGGTVVPLHLGELARQEFRPTRDVDVVVKSLTYTEYSAIGRRLRAHGFVDCQRAGAPLCRYERDGIEVDVMPIDPSVLGFSNPWYAKGWPHRTAVSLPSGRIVEVFQVEYLLASKIVAYESRGDADPYASRDFEDIVTLLDGVPELLARVVSADEELATFVSDWLRRALARVDIADVLAGHVSRIAGPGRAAALHRKLKGFVAAKFSDDGGAAR